MDAHHWPKRVAKEAFGVDSRLLLVEFCFVDGHLCFCLHQIFTSHWSLERCTGPGNVASNAQSGSCFTDDWGSLLDAGSYVDRQPYHAWAAVKSSLAVELLHPERIWLAVVAAVNGFCIDRLLHDLSLTLVETERKQLTSINHGLNSEDRHFSSRSSTSTDQHSEGELLVSDEDNETSGPNDSDIVGLESWQAMSLFQAGRSLGCLKNGQVVDSGGLVVAEDSDVVSLLSS